MGQVTTGPVDYPYEKEKKEAERTDHMPEPKEEPTHGPVEGVDQES